MLVNAFLCGTDVARDAVTRVDTACLGGLVVRRMGMKTEIEKVDGMDGDGDGGG